jgi:hypothetical protein
MDRMSVFKPAARYPADPRAVFILALSVFSGITALALQVAPDSLNALLPTWAVVAWGGLLSGGSAVTLVGMLRQTVNGIILEQVGCVTVAATTVFYSGVVFYEIGPEAIQSVGIILAWGLSCILRYAQLQVLINDAQARADKLAFLARIESDIAARAQREIDRQRLHVDPRHDHLGQWRK